MKVAMGCDHAALHAKEELKSYLLQTGMHVHDFGTESEASCDYPDYAAAVSRAVQSGECERGILICGTGIGMSIAANRFSHIRAALCYTEELAQLSRLHNDANVLCMGARTQSILNMKKIVDVWFSTEWEGDRHARRLDKIERNPGT